MRLREDTIVTASGSYSAAAAPGSSSRKIHHGHFAALSAPQLSGGGGGALSFMLTVAALAAIFPASASVAAVLEASDASGKAAAALTGEAGASGGTHAQMLQLLHKLGEHFDSLSLLRSNDAQQHLGRGRGRAVSMYNTSVLLDQVKRAAENAVSGIRLDPMSTDILVSITDTLVQTVMPDIFEQHTDSQRAVNMSANAIAICNDTLVHHLSGLPGINNSIDAKREAHLQCRDEHLDADMQVQEASSTLASLLTSLEGPVEGCDVANVSQNSTFRDLVASSDIEAWLQNLIEWGVTNLAILDASAKECENAEHNVSHTCDKYQMQFESAYCQYRQIVRTWCQDHTTCFDSSVRAYNQTVEEQLLTVEHLKVEYEALEKIICYLGVLTKNFTSVDAQSAELDHCQNLVIDTSILDLWIPAVPPAHDCPEYLVAIYPGHELWVPTEYAGFEGIVAPVLACEVSAHKQNSTANASLAALVISMATSLG